MKDASDTQTPDLLDPLDPLELAQKKGQPVPASPKQNDQAPITAPHQDSTPAVQEVKP